MPEERNRAIDAVWYSETFRAAIRKGYQHAELSLIVEQNMPMRHTVKALGACSYTTYRVYAKRL